MTGPAPELPLMSPMRRRWGDVDWADSGIGQDGYQDGYQSPTAPAELRSEADWEEALEKIRETAEPQGGGSEPDEEMNPEDLLPNAPTGSAVDPPEDPLPNAPTGSAVAKPRAKYIDASVWKDVFPRIPKPDYPPVEVHCRYGAGFLVRRGW